MGMDPNELREELLAVLAAHRELDVSADEELVDGLIEKVERLAPKRARYPDLRAAYDALVPLKFSVVAAIAVAQGVILVGFGEYMLRDVIDLYYGADGFAQAWMTFALIWIVEVIVTVAVISMVTPREERARPRSRAQRTSRRPRSSF